MNFALGLARLPGNELIQVVAVGAVSAEVLLIEEALDAAAQADLIRVLLETNWPAHFAMPATAQNQHGGSGNSSCNQTQGNFPTRLLFLSHPTEDHPIAGQTARPTLHSSSPGRRCSRKPRTKVSRFPEKYCDCPQTPVTYTVGVLCRLSQPWAGSDFRTQKGTCEPWPVSPNNECDSE